MRSACLTMFVCKLLYAYCPNHLEISGDPGKLVLEDGKLKWRKLHAHEREFCFTSIVQIKFSKFGVS